MDINTIRQKYINFFIEKAGHKQIPAAPLIPPDDPTTLFTSSGMQQLVPYLKGEEHPMGTRLVDSQPCFRAEDIEEVGDNRHTTFFEMLGNWSLGDYFKEEQIVWFWEFLTKEIGLQKERLHVTVFEGDANNNIPKDEEAYKIWIDLGVGKDNIHYYDATKNWWSRAGVPKNMPAGEIGGPDSEVFYDFDPDQKMETHKKSEFKDEKCHVNCDCGRFLEIGNSVFMQYIKKESGAFEPLPNQNVDFGGGLERIVAASQNQPDMFEIELFSEIVKEIENFTEKNYEDENKTHMRVIADHMRAATIMIAQNILPGNKMQGSVVRRLIRRSAVKLHQLRGGLTSSPSLGAIAEEVLRQYDGVFLDRKQVREKVSSIIDEEMDKFARALDRGLLKLEKATKEELVALLAFDLKQTHGFPPEVTEELFKQRGRELDWKEFNLIEKKHKDLSRTTAAKVFKGGLADNSEDVTKLHTATHLLHKSLQQVLGDEVRQEGSNITSERLRFDYKYSDKPTEDQIKKIEELMNQKISEDLPVTKSIEDKQIALDSGVMAFFRETYPEKVSVYTIGNDSKGDWFSKELCGGPHVSSTGEIGTVTIKKDKSIGANVRRVYVMLASTNGNQKHLTKNKSNS
ncbi:alanine--tRNA ligase [Patescibacteria group bacterium]